MFSYQKKKKKIITLFVTLSGAMNFFFTGGFSSNTWIYHWDMPPSWLYFGDLDFVFKVRIYLRMLKMGDSDWVLEIS